MYSKMRWKKKGKLWRARAIVAEDELKRFKERMEKEGRLIRLEVGDPGMDKGWECWIPFDRPMTFVEGDTLEVTWNWGTVTARGIKL